jgi:hypothetical protein
MKSPCVLLFLTVAIIPVAVLGQSNKIPIKSGSTALHVPTENVPIKAGSDAIASREEKIPVKTGGPAATAPAPTARLSAMRTSQPGKTEKTASEGAYKPAVVTEKIPAPVILQQGEPTPPVIRTNTAKPKAEKH